MEPHLRGNMSQITINSSESSQCVQHTFGEINRFSVKFHYYESLLEKVGKFERNLSLDEAVQKLTSSHFQGMLYFPTDTTLTSSKLLNTALTHSSIPPEDYKIKNQCGLPEPQCETTTTRNHAQSLIKHHFIRRHFNHGDVCFLKDGLAHFADYIEPYSPTNSQGILFFKTAT